MTKRIRGLVHARPRADRTGPASGLLSTSIALGLGATLVPWAAASTHLVSKIVDDGTAGTLRNAIIDANADVSPPVTVDASGIAGPATITLDGGLGQISITRSMTVKGPGASKLSVSGNNASRIFSIVNASTTTPMDVTITGLTLKAGHPASGSGGALYANRTNLTLNSSVISGNTSGGSGGGVYALGDFANHVYPALTVQNTTFNGSNYASQQGGALSAFNTGAVTIDHSTFANNSAGQMGGSIYLSTIGDLALTNSNVTGSHSGLGGSFGEGGGLHISISGTATIDHCVISGNTAAGGNDGGGVTFQYGSAVITQSTISGNSTASGGGGGVRGKQGTLLSIADSRITGNSAGFGGGVYNSHRPITLHRTLLSGNTATLGYGGGLLIGNTYDSGPKNGDVLVDASTFVANRAFGAGGGIAIQDADSNTSITLQNLTIVGNTADTANAGNVGGGIAIDDESIAPMIGWSTITDNKAARGGGLAVADINNSTAGTATIPTVHDSILARNLKTTANPDVSGKFVANYDVFSNTTGGVFLGGLGNQTADPLLGSLGNYGGPTPTKLPKAGSPALDHGDPAPVTLPGADQRGKPRVVNTRVDVGADERQANEDTIFLDGIEGY